MKICLATLGLFVLGAAEDDTHLLQQHSGTSRKQAVKPAVNTAFALKELGPFPLVSTKVNLDVNTKRGRWKTDGMDKKGKLATSMAMTCDGSDYWLGASSVAWAYPPRKAGLSDDATRQFSQYGGFILFDDDDEVTHTLQIDTSEDNAEMTMYFDEPFGITMKEWTSCQNPAKITIDSLSQAGAKRYCWETKHHMCQRGCFLYETTKGYQAFPVKDFAFQSLGPFPLSSRSDLGDKFPVVGKALGSDGSDFWLGATHVTWLEPNGDGGIRDSATGALEQYGGFHLSDKKGGNMGVLELNAAATQPDMTLQFSKPFHVSKKKWEACKGQHPITIASLASYGAQEYCWQTDPWFCKLGCFLYKTTSGYQGFAVKPYSLSELGPFNLVDRKDLDIAGTIDGHYATIGDQRYPLAAPASCQDGSSSTCKVYWAYQPRHFTVESAFAGSFETYGGFIIADEKKKIFYEIGKPSDKSGYSMSFSPPFHISKTEFESCKNPARITLKHLDALNYCWQPDGVRCPHGCFYYKTAGGYQGFSVKK